MILANAQGFVLAIAQEILAIAQELMVEMQGLYTESKMVPSSCIVEEAQRDGEAPSQREKSGIQREREKWNSERESERERYVVFREREKSGIQRERKKWYSEGIQWETGTWYSGQAISCFDTWI